MHCYKKVSILLCVDVKLMREANSIIIELEFMVEAGARHVQVDEH